MKLPYPVAGVTPLWALLAKDPVGYGFRLTVLSNDVPHRPSTGLLLKAFGYDVVESIQAGAGMPPPAVLRNARRILIEAEAELGETAIRQRLAEMNR